MTRVALVPGVLALLPEYAGLDDPVAELRVACRAAVGWLAEGGSELTVVADEQGARLAEHLLEQAGVSTRLLRNLFRGRRRAPFLNTRLDQRGATDQREWRDPQQEATTSYLVVGNGSACRTEKAPGHLDQRAHAFDEALGIALRAADREALAAIDPVLSRELWASTESLTRLAEILPAGCAATVDYADDPFGVQYWVIRWET